MASVRRTARRVQPASAAPIDPGSPYAKALKFFAHGGVGMRDLVRGVKPSYFNPVNVRRGKASYVGNGGMVSYDNHASLCLLKAVPFAVGVWIREPQPSGGYAGLIGRWDGGNQGWSFGRLNGPFGVTARVGNNDQSIAWADQAHGKESVCYFFASDGSTLTMYLDGVAIGSINTPPWTAITDDTFRLGVLRSNAAYETIMGGYEAVMVSTGQVLSARDVASLSRNPYQLLAPVRRRRASQQIVMPPYTGPRRGYRVDGRWGSLESSSRGYIANGAGRVLVPVSRGYFSNGIRRDLP